MWNYYYVSAARLRVDFADVIGDLPVERLLASEQSAAADGAVHGGTSGLISTLFGVKAEASLDFDAGAKKRQEQKLTLTPEAVVRLVAERLRRVDHTVIDDSASASNLNATKGLVRFRGQFRPNTRGPHPAARMTTFDAVPATRWEGRCGDVTLRFITNRSSFLSPTPVYPAFDSPRATLLMDGFGTLAARPSKSILRLVPLVIGLEAGL